MPSFLLIRQCCRRAWRLSAVRAVAAGWMRLGDKSLSINGGPMPTAGARGAALTDYQYVAIAGISVQAQAPLKRIEEITRGVVRRLNRGSSKHPASVALQMSGGARFQMVLPNQ